MPARQGCRRLQRAENKILGAATWLVMTAYLVATLNDSTGGSGRRSLTDALALANYVGIVASIALLLRSWRAGVYSDSDGITVRNVFRSHRFSWSTINCFYIGTHRVVKAPASIVKLRDGSEVRMSNISPPNPRTRPKNQEAQQIIEALNKELQESHRRGTI